MRMVIALGGNAIKKPKEKGTAEEQFRNVKETCESIWDLFREHEIVITHGNGPQVGSILMQQETGEPVVPGMPLDICVAESQGLIGYMIQQSLKAVLEAHRIRKDVVTLITQVVVDAKDPAFQNPTKPVGPFLTPEKVGELRNRGVAVIEDAGRGYRRVVPSPDPRHIVEGDVIKALLDRGVVVIGAGGGGIPVRGDGTWCGIEAVIDKDLASEVLAESIEADCFIMLTDVDKVALNYKKENERLLDALTIEEALHYLEEGHFAPGSMGPKILAAVRFMKAGGKKALITSPQKVSQALGGLDGTEITM